VRSIARLAVLAAVAVLLHACASVPISDAPSFRVMTFNIRLDVASDGPNVWPHRKEIVASMIHFHDADLVGVQEALPQQLRDLDALLPEFGRFGVGRAADLTDEHSAIFYRKSRFEVLEQGTFWLSETPEVAGSKGWDAALPRIVTRGRLRDRRTRAIFFHFNTHFDHVGKVARRESAALVVRKIGASQPVILTGDFNDTPQSDAYRSITSSSLVDAFTVSRAMHHGPTTTWNGFEAIEPQRRIDFIFIRGFDVLRHGILSETFDDARFPSDHLPVLAEVRVTSPGRSDRRRPGG